MRLINTTTLEFKEFLGNQTPAYAILSHVWSSNGDEVSYEDYLAGRKREGYGYQKILRLCELAKSGFWLTKFHDPKFDPTKPEPPAPESRRRAFERDVYSDSAKELVQLEWAWIDTCCIDKRSSAELSEAINSMYSWYQHAEICLVFLPDVHHLGDPHPTHITNLQEHWQRALASRPDLVESCNDIGQGISLRRQWLLHCVNLSALKLGAVQADGYAPFDTQQFLRSRWFRRGWTLQELIAPGRLVFYNTSFMAIGSAHEGDFLSSKTNPNKKALCAALSLHVLVAQAAGVSINIICAGYTLGDTPCIAQRMSWASKRFTTRGEDMAYCLLGLFNVNMPLLYGEGGERAFRRLQVAILSQSTDQSIFMHLLKQRLLARDPSSFYQCRDAMLISNSTKTLLLQSSFQLTQRGFEVDILLPRNIVPRKWPYELLYPLRCATPNGPFCYMRIEVQPPQESAHFMDGVFLAKRQGIIFTDGHHEAELLRTGVFRPAIFIARDMATSQSFVRGTNALDSAAARTIWKTEPRRPLSQNMVDFARRSLNIFKDRQQVRLLFSHEDMASY